jgi:hypothetical protein
VDREAIFDTPENAAAAGTVGETLDVDASGDGRWAVVVRRHPQGLGFTLCKSVYGGWVFEDEGEMTTSERDSFHSTWISLVDVEDGPNVGVEISWGGAPPGTLRAVLRSGDEEFAVPVHDGGYWFVRWQAPDPAEDDDDELEVIHFASESPPRRK